MGVKVLLDTHVIIWLVGRGPSVPEHVRSALSEADAVLASVVSAYEVTTKISLGKLEAARELGERWTPSVRRIGAITLELSEPAALEAGRLEWAHRDPFDRLLAAQARADQLTLLSADPAFDSAPGLRLLRW